MPSSPRSRDPSAEACASIVLDAFTRYNADFRALTRRAKQRFEQRDWHGLQCDNRERIELYETAVQSTLSVLTDRLGEALTSRALWRGAKEAYAELIDGHRDIELTKTFYSSITRRIFATVGVASDIEFVAVDLDPMGRIEQCRETNVYWHEGQTRPVVRRLLSDYWLDTIYADFSASIDYIATEIDARCASLFDYRGANSIELLRPLFFQNTRAYLVGRINRESGALPLVIALANGVDGLYADAVLMSEDEISILFGFTRSYCMADLEAVGEAVVFLKSLMPRKPVAELYTVLGRAKQGKTETYRALFQHLEASEDCFEPAPGTKGMVMIVFTLPSYDVVFKVIRDRFAYPKAVRRRQVMARYQLVFKHDRAGRLVDAQEFRHLKFERRRFQPELLEELLEHAADTVKLDGDELVVRHVYTERRLTPLNVFLAEADRIAARQVVLDYGQAIRDLARTNIFPGDLLLKNFGVTRHRRVIFYDYDELCLLTDCRFRRLPEPRHPEEELEANTWFYVGDNDVFPEQFPSFMGLRGELLETFMEYHGELLDADYWRDIQQRLVAGEVLEIVPYRRNIY